MKYVWTINKVIKLFKKPFLEIIFEAQNVHRKHFNPNKLQISTLLSIKTGSCPEDCKYCPQSSRYKTNIKKEKLLGLKDILKLAKKAKDSGSDRFCMGAAWKNPNDRDIPHLESVIKEIKKMGMETCMTLGSLTVKQAKKLANAGLDFYNHNLDTSPEFYSKIISTRKYEDRLNTLNIIRNSGIKICSGGIIGLGENINDRAKLLLELSKLPKPPESIPINMLVKIKGTPMENNDDVDPFDFIRMIAITRIMMPNSYIRLSAGRENMNEQTQAMCFMAGANSLFYGCKLLTASNPNKDTDLVLFKKLGLTSEKRIESNLNKEINNIMNNNNDFSLQYYNAEL
ncbi:biotin synthase BioB [Buchnera aphidicola (Neophyllaphis podocarpi)]|uniref:biotin synthase BioB n=1 Tax=Buchnera aphidicola TaxID=9 RepID=UPI0031B8327B